jgi:hypothetical protein
MAVWALLRIEAPNGSLRIPTQRQLSRLRVEDNNRITTTSAESADGDLLGSCGMA